MAWLFEQAAVHGKQGRNYWWVAPTMDVSRIAFRRLKLAIPREIFHANETFVNLTLLNGAVIWFKGADRPDTLYGEDVYACVLDEASRCKEEAWTAVRTTLSATRGPIRIIGNVKGRQNWAYRLARKAEAGASDMAYFKITAEDAEAAGVFPKGELEDAKSVLPAGAFRELYYAIPADDGGNPFGLTAIQDCTVAAGSGRGPWQTSVAVCGGPRTGKSTVARQLAALGLEVQATDDLIAQGWSEASESASQWFGRRGIVVEGVAVARALRKWLAAHPAGRPCDIVLVLTDAYTPLSPGQATMAKGCATVWAEILPELLVRGVEVTAEAEPLIARLTAEKPAATAAVAGYPELWGWDFARAQDWTVGIALDQANQVVRLERWQRIPWEETYRRVCKAQGTEVGWGDSTGIGDVVIETLQGRGCLIQPYQFTAKSKQLLMERLASALQQRAVRFPDGPIRAELETFGYEYTASGVRYSAPDGLHDDCVMALALAIYGRDQVGYLGDQYAEVEPTPDRHPGLAVRYPHLAHRLTDQPVQPTRPRFKPTGRMVRD